MRERTCIDDPSRLTIRQRLGFLAKDSFLYGGANAFNKAFALITFPLLARKFSVEEYGVIDYFTILAALITSVLVFGQDSAVARFFYEYTETSKRKQVISQSLVFQIGLIGFFLPLLRLFSTNIAGWVSHTPQAETLLELVLLQVPFRLLINFSQNILKWTFARARFLFISIGSTCFTVAALLVGIVFFNFGVIEVFVVYVATQIIFGFLGLWFCRHWLARPKDWRYLKEMLPFAVPYGVMCTIGAFIPAMERTFIVEFLGGREMGLFSAGTKVAMLIALPIQAFQVAWGPFSMAIHKDVNAVQTYNWVLKIFAYGLFVLVLMLSVVAEPVIHFLASDRYIGSSVVVFPMAISLAVQAISWITAIGIGLSKRSYLNLYAYIIFLVVSVISIYALLNIFGLVGVAWGALLGYLAKAATETWLAQRAYPLPWNFSGVIVMGLGTLVVGLISQTLFESFSHMAGTLSFCFGLLVILILGWMTLFSRDDRYRIDRAIRQLCTRIGYL